MSFIKKIKNVSGSEKIWNGQGIDANAVFIIPNEEDHHWRGNQDVIDAINDDEAEIGDGTTWYTGAEALTYLYAFNIKSSLFFVTDPNTPSSVSANGIKGQICWDSGYIYICIDTNTWKRTALSTW